MILAAMVVAVALLAASPALAQDEPKVVADAKAKTATAGGAMAEADCSDQMIEAKAGGVVAKAPCKAPPPPPPKAAPAPALPQLLARLRLRLRRPSFRRPVVPALPRYSRLARALCWWAVASWPAGSSGSNGKHSNEYRGGTVRPRPYSFATRERYSEYLSDV